MVNLEKDSRGLVHGWKTELETHEAHDLMSAVDDLRSLLRIGAAIPELQHQLSECDRHLEFLKTKFYKSKRGIKMFDFEQELLLGDLGYSISSNGAIKYVGHGAFVLKKSHNENENFRLYFLFQGQKGKICVWSSEAINHFNSIPTAETNLFYRTYNPPLVFRGITLNDFPG